VRSTLRGTACGAALVALALAGCSSSGGSHASSTPPSSAASTISATALSDKIKAGLTGLTSAHLAVDAGPLGGTSSGDFSFENGTATASDITLNNTKVITIDGTSYAKLPRGQNTSGKPWVKVSQDSSNEFVRGLAGALSVSKAAASLPAIADLAATATSVKADGNTYTLVIDPSKSSGTTLGALLGATGQKTVPVQVTLDDKGRPAHIRVNLKLANVDITISDFDAPVHITAPPADQVAGG
jgi:hypothetical protein